MMILFLEPTTETEALMTRLTFKGGPPSLPPAVVVAAAVVFVVVCSRTSSISVVSAEGLLPFSPVGVPSEGSALPVVKEGEEEEEGEGRRAVRMTSARDSACCITLTGLGIARTLRCPIRRVEESTVTVFPLLVTFIAGEGVLAGCVGGRGKKSCCASKGGAPSAWEGRRWFGEGEDMVKGPGTALDGE